MRRVLLLAIGLGAVPCSAIAQQYITTPSGKIVQAYGSYAIVNGAPISASNPLPVSGAGSGGSGAITAAAGSFADGAITTLGTEADAAWSGSGSATEIALLKALYAAEVADAPRASVTISSLPSLPAGPNAIGTVGVTALPPLAAGSSAIGTVGVTSLPPLPAGSNALGTVGVTALPAIPPGGNAIGTVGVTSLPPIPAGANAIGSVTVTALPPLPAGANSIGSVNVASEPSLPSGANTIGAVNQGSSPWSDQIGVTPPVSAAAGNVGTPLAASGGSIVLKASPGLLFGAYATTTAATYLMVFNATTVPADGAVTPTECVLIPANTTGSVSYPTYPEYFSTGIVVVASSTGCFTKTLVTTAFLHGTVK